MDEFEKIEDFCKQNNITIKIPLNDEAAEKVKMFCDKNGYNYDKFCGTSVLRTALGGLVSAITSSIDGMFKNVVANIANALSKFPSKQEMEAYYKRNRKRFAFMEENEWFYDRGFLLSEYSGFDEEIFKIRRKRVGRKELLDNLMFTTYNSVTLDSLYEYIRQNIESAEVQGCLKQCFNAYKNEDYYLTVCGSSPIIDYILRLKDSHFCYGTDKAQGIASSILIENEDHQPLEIVGNNMAKLFNETYYARTDATKYNRDIPNRNNIHGMNFSNFTQKGALNCLIIISLLSAYLRPWEKI